MKNSWETATFQEKVELVVYFGVLGALGLGVMANRVAQAAEAGSGTEVSVMEIVKATPKITALLYRSDSLKNEFEKAARCHTKDECRDLRDMSTIFADQEKTSEELKPYFKMMADFCRSHQNLPNCSEMVRLADEAKAREIAMAEDKKRADAQKAQVQPVQPARWETNKQKVCWIGQEPDTKGDKYSEARPFLTKYAFTQEGYLMPYVLDPAEKKWKKAHLALAGFSNALIAGLPSKDGECSAPGTTKIDVRSTQDKPTIIKEAGKNADGTQFTRLAEFQFINTGKPAK